MKSRTKLISQTKHSTVSLPSKTDMNKENSSKERDSAICLSQLKQHVKEVKNNVTVLEAEPDLATAISMLDAALNRRDQAIKSHNEQNPANLPTGTGRAEASSGPPSLPPILDDQLEKAVFTHPGQDSNPAVTYDRLEILGDAYIELIATKLVWDRFPSLPSGRMSQIRESLVKNETLAAYADVYGFAHKAIVPPGYATQAKRWIKTKGDIFEAYVAAVILSDPMDGYRNAERWLTGLWLPKLVDLGLQKSDLHSKEELAKLVMAKGIKLEYVEEKSAMQPKGTGSQTFFIGVYLTGWGWEKKHLGSGQGPSKNAAGDRAAKSALANTSLIAQISQAKKLSLSNKMAESSPTIHYIQVLIIGFHALIYVQMTIN